MIDLSASPLSTVAVLGLARSGVAAALALQAAGKTVLAWDDNPAAREAAAKAGVTLSDLNVADWKLIDALSLSPGIPHSFPTPNPITVKAKAAGCELLSDNELLARAIEGKGIRLVAITGTNGKSTTTALTGHLLKSAGVATEVGGNLGFGALALAPLPSGGVYVLELSSYQLELMPTAVFDVAVLLNISPDHLDRHGGMEGYVAAKRRIFAGQHPGQVAVIGMDDDWCRSISAELDRRAVTVVRIDPDQPGLDLTEAKALPGRHNAQNAAAAIAICRALGVEDAAIQAGLNSFPGLRHRQQQVATLSGVTFVNDSKATNADAAGNALGCYDAIYWIAGGVPKEGGVESLRKFFPRVRHAYLIGHAAKDFSETLGDTPHCLCGDLAAAVRMAFAQARRDGIQGAVVLLSPACASFDQYPNFERRGDHFIDLVEQLKVGASA